jgi:3-phenylpropionate/cinnamic acid dioxygenase small subunit
MSDLSYKVNQDSQLQFRVEQFYYQEAHLLDSREFYQWVTLLTADMQYIMPGRYSPQRDSKKRGQENFLAVDDELQREAIDAVPLREENALIMAFRAQRAYKANAWGSNPPARTRRLISNVIVEVLDGKAEYRVKSNFILYYSRHRQDNHIYSGQRIDCLYEVDGVFKIARREVILDWNVITAPTVGLFF